MPIESGWYLIYVYKDKIVEASWFRADKLCFTYEVREYGCYNDTDYKESEVSHWMEMPKGTNELD